MCFATFGLFATIVELPTARQPADSKSTTTNVADHRSLPVCTILSSDFVRFYKSNVMHVQTHRGSEVLPPRHRLDGRVQITIHVINRADACLHRNAWTSSLRETDRQSALYGHAKCRETKGASRPPSGNRLQACKLLLHTTPERTRTRSESAHLENGGFPLSVLVPTLACRR